MSYNLTLSAREICDINHGQGTSFASPAYVKLIIISHDRQKQ